MRSENASPILEARRVGRQAPDDPAQWLLDQVSIAIHAGERVALVGASGSGKTLLLRALVLLDAVDAGEVRWQGQRVVGNAIPVFRRQAVYLHQRTSPVDGSVEAFLRHPFELAVYRDDRFERAQVVQWLEQLGRSEAFLDKSHRDLSGGESQIASLLRVLQLNPKVLLLDEPTAAMDEQTTSHVEAVLTRWFEQRSTARSLVWVTHNRQQARRVADRVVRMESGTIVDDACATSEIAAEIQ